MSPRGTIEFLDPRGLADLKTFLGRARTAAPTGAIRFQHVSAGVMLLTVPIIDGDGLLGEGAVVGLRVVPIRSAPEGLDLTVAFASISDRLARLSSLDSVLPIPPVSIDAPWASLTPPQNGWERVGDLTPQEIRDAAAEGIEVIAQGSPEGAGAKAVAALRRRVWSRMTETVPPIVSGLAFGAHVLGFVADSEPLVVSTCGRWSRLSTPRGHVLAR